MERTTAQQETHAADALLTDHDVSGEKNHRLMGTPQRRIPYYFHIPSSPALAGLVGVKLLFVGNFLFLGFIQRFLGGLPFGVVFD